MTNSVAALESAVAEVVACSSTGQLYNSGSGTCEEPPHQGGSTTECLRPACGEGTQAQGGKCIPDCEGLRRRSLDSHPFCDGPDDNLETTIPTTPTSPQSSGSNDGMRGGNGPAIIIGAVSGTIILVLLTAIACQRTNRQATVPPTRPDVVNPAYSGPLYDAVSYAEVGSAAPGTAQAPLYDEVEFVRDQYAAPNLQPPQLQLRRVSP